MKTAPLASFVMAILALSTFSCKKSNDGGANSTNKTTLLTLQAWKIKSIGIDVNKDGTSDGDATAYFTACRLDNTWLFKTDGTGVGDEGASKCLPADPQSAPFSWAFKNNETILGGTYNLAAKDLTIISLNETNLVVSYDDDFLSMGSTQRAIITLQH
jgi:hypothetical protein